MTSVRSSKMFPVDDCMAIRQYYEVTIICGHWGAWSPSRCPLKYDLEFNLKQTFKFTTTK